MYAWATPDYLLDHMSLVQILMYYDYGIEHEKNKSRILVGQLAVGLFGAEEEKPKSKPKTQADEKPDREAFYQAYGDKIKRPGGAE